MTAAQQGPRAVRPAARRPRYWTGACRELGARDAVLAGLMARHRDAVLVRRGEAFATLARAIVSQQISTRAAEAIWNRLGQALGEVAPDRVLAQAPDALRAPGLTARKAEYLRDLAGHFADGRLDPKRWRRSADAALIAQLTAVRGIGRWTAEMFLIFHLNRPDVWPADDMGLQKAVARHYLDGRPPQPKELAAWGERYAPWRTVATWYLWRSLDAGVVQY